MKIEFVSPEDAAELVEIYAPYVKNTAITFEYEVPTVEEFTNRITNTIKKFPYIKAVNDENQIVGYAYVGAFKTRAAYDWSVETSIYVRQDCKHQGIGKALYDQLECCCKKMGILNMNACIAYAKVEDQYLTNDSVRFHEKNGYKMVGTFHDCANKFGIWYNMVWMEKYIGDHSANPAPVNFGSYR